MKRFRKWRDTYLDEFRESSDHSMNGTPLGTRGEEFRAFMMEVNGFEPGAPAYVYFIILKRRTDNSNWYYVGETTGGLEGLKSRFETHLRCSMWKPIERNGVEIIDGAIEHVNHSYAMIGVDRTEPISAKGENLLNNHVAERERRMAYEVAIEYETTNVIGGA